MLADLVPQLYSSVFQEPQPFCQAVTQFQLMYEQVLLASASSACLEWGCVGKCFSGSWSDLITVT